MTGRVFCLGFRDFNHNKTDLMESSSDKILAFLKDIAYNNNREWFAENKARYEETRTHFEEMVQQLIHNLSTFEPSISNLRVKDCTYRFYRDTRFSLDKSPYKRHLGAYINIHGKKAYHGGYYFHLEPGHCMLAGGAYCLPTPILNNVRHYIVENLDEYRTIVESPTFKTHFPTIGETHLKTLPKGFPKDFPYPDYLRPKDFSIAHLLPDNFFATPDWLTPATEIFHLMKPYLDFINAGIDEGM